MLFLDQYVIGIDSSTFSMKLWDVGGYPMIFAVATEIVLGYIAVIEILDIFNVKGLNKAHMVMHYVAIIAILLSINTFVWQIGLCGVYADLSIWAIIMFVCTLSSAICALIDAKLRR